MNYDYKDERYLFLDYIKVKNKDSRAWEVHALYQDKKGIKHSREVNEFFDRFKEVRPDYPAGWSDGLTDYLKGEAKAKRYIHGQDNDIIE